MAENDDQKAQDAEWMEKYDLSEDSIKELREAFATFDEDDVGMIDPDHLGNVLRTMKQNPTEAECTEMIKQLDLNDQGQVTLDEFVKVVFSNIEMKSDMESEESLENAMKYFDSNQQGFILAEDLRQKLKTMGEPLDDADIDELLKTAEVDKEGKINYYAFIQAMMSD